MNLHKHQLYLLEQHSEWFKSWSAIIRINTELIDSKVGQQLLGLTLSSLIQKLVSNY